MDQRVRLTEAVQRMVRRKICFCLKNAVSAGTMSREQDDEFHVLGAPCADPRFQPNPILTLVIR